MASHTVVTGTLSALKKNTPARLLTPLELHSVPEDPANALPTHVIAQSKATPAHQGERRGNENRFVIHWHPTENRLKDAGLQGVLSQF
jgi:hypothetical protein